MSGSFGMSTLKVTALNTTNDGRVRVTLSDGADGTVILLTGKDTAPQIGTFWRVDFTSTLVK